MTDVTRKRHKEVQRGKDAEALLDNPLLKEVFDNIENTIETGWKGTPEKPSSPDVRERAYLLHRLLWQFKAEIGYMIRDGKSAVGLLKEQERVTSRRAKPASSKRSTTD